ncbi:MAG: hypothetical protein ABSG91_17270 [Syntrophobacteraceae bacterium]|jgi:hypothetical protein
MNKISELREKYRPKQGIKYLLIAESPPNCEGTDFRFFYNPDNEKYDFMFRNVMRVIFPEFDTEYRKGMKHQYLEKFCQAGFYMIDATDEPVNRLKGKQKLEAIRKDWEGKLAEIESIISKETPIFLITKNVFTVFYQRLRENGYTVRHNEPIPFPGQGHQVRFREVFKRYLSDCGYPADS